MNDSLRVFGTYNFIIILTLFTNTYVYTSVRGRETGLGLDTSLCGFGLGLEPYGLGLDLGLEPFSTETSKKTSN